MGRKIQLDDQLACEIGIKEALVLSQINFWLQKKPHWRDGSPWIYNTYEQWQEQLCFYSRDSIKLALKKLRELGLITSSNYNKFRGDRTRWYTIHYDHPILEKSNVGWKCPASKIPSVKTSPTIGEKLPDTQGKTPLSEKGKINRSNQYKNTKDEQQKIILKPEEGWLPSLSENMRQQVIKYTDKIVASRKSSIRDPAAYRNKVYRNIKEGNQPDFKPQTDEEMKRLAFRHGGVDIEVLEYCTPPAEWPRVKAEFEAKEAHN